jgi:protein-tyrosine phosphatase
MNTEQAKEQTCRDLHLEVAFNVRHIGGYQTRDGRETSSMFVRAASLHRLSDDGVDGLLAAGIRTVIDLRSDEERQRMATPALAPAGIDHVFAPVFQSDASPGSLVLEHGSFAPAYERFLCSGHAAYLAMFRIAATASGGVLFHCAAGKDRTGVAAALLLDLAGVEDDDIVADYAASAPRIRDAFADWKRSPAEEAAAATMTPEQRDRMLSSDPEVMHATLQFLRRRWGSARGYMAAIGLSPREIRELRARLVEP